VKNWIFAAAWVWLAVGAASAAPFLDFPTANRELRKGHPDRFFMDVNRDFDGKRTQPVFQPN